MDWEGIGKEGGLATIIAGVPIGPVIESGMIAMPTRYNSTGGIQFQIGHGM